jgi:hypothetical protein
MVPPRRKLSSSTKFLFFWHSPVGTQIKLTATRGSLAVKTLFQNHISDMKQQIQGGCKLSLPNRNRSQSRRLRDSPLAICELPLGSARNTHVSTSPLETVPLLTKCIPQPCQSRHLEGRPESAFCQILRGSATWRCSTGLQRARYGQTCTAKNWPKRVESLLYKCSWTRITGRSRMQS